MIEEFKQSGISKEIFSRGYGIDRTTFNHWLNRYERNGIDGLREARHNNHYSKSLKLEVVVTCPTGQYSLEEVALKFGLRSKKQLRDWISKYNKDKTVTASPSKRQVPIMSRKATFEERISIIEYVTKDKHSYTEAAEHFGVSYQQVRSWVKAQQGGYEALADNRGHHKTQSELTVLDLYGRRLLSYHLSPTETSEAEVQVFQQAFAGAGSVVHPMVHTDRRSAYTSKMFSRYLDQYEVTRSMSRPGTPYDNSTMERWWNEFKYRWVARHPMPKAYQELMKLVEAGIEYFNNYNRSTQRNGLTPDEYWNTSV